MIRPGRLADVGLAGREERRVRPAVAERHAEALRRAVDDVGAEFTGRHEHRQRQQIGADGHQGTGLVCTRDDRRDVADRPVSIGVLHHHPEHIVCNRVGVGDEVDLQAERLGARDEQFAHLREHLADDEHPHRGRGLLADTPQQRHRFGRGGGLVEQRRVGDVHAREVADRRLEGQQGLETPLGDLGLVRRVRRVPARVLEHHALDDGRRVGVVVAGADEGPEPRVLRLEGAQARQEGGFGLGRWLDERVGPPDVRGHDLVDQRVQRRHAEDVQHAVAVLGSGADVAKGKRVGGRWSHVEQGLALGERPAFARPGPWASRHVRRWAPRRRHPS